MSVTTPRLASTIELPDLDREVDPVVDLYGFANGGWLARTAVPPHRSVWGPAYELRGRILAELVNSCREVAAVPSGRSDELVGAFFSSAAATRAREDGLTQLGAEISRLDEIRTHRDVAEAVARLHVTGIVAGFRAVVFPSQSDSRKCLLHLQRGGLALPTPQLYVPRSARDTELLAEYRRFASALLRLAGRTATQPAERAVELEIRLAKAHALTPDAAQSHARLVQVADLPRGFHWDAYLALLPGPRVRALDLFDAEYIATFAQIVGSTPAEDWSDYLLLQLLRTMAPYLGAPFSTLHDDFFGRQLRGLAVRSTPEETAVEAIESFIGQALGVVYTRRHLDHDALTSAADLVRCIRNAFAHAVQTSTWDRRTKAAVIKKFNAIHFKIGRPSRPLAYEGLSVSREAYATNVSSASAWAFKRRMELVGLPISIAEWRVAPTNPDTFYSQVTNDIHIPAAVLRPPFFDPAGDPARNYGGLGVVVAHEIAHAIDDEGSHYDETGTIRETWHEGDRRKLDAFWATIQERLISDPAAPAEANPRLWLAETFADIVGLRVAFRAFQADPAFSGVAIGGLTPAQRFFVAFAQLRRRIFREAELMNRLAMDPHPPGEIRVRHALRGMEGFAMAFGAAMEHGADFFSGGP